MGPTGVLFGLPGNFWIANVATQTAKLNHRGAKDTSKCMVPGVPDHPSQQFLNPVTTTGQLSCPPPFLLC